METSIEIIGKTLKVDISPVAISALARQTESLVVEMELYFSCLIRKRLLFHLGEPQGQASSVMDGLSVRFRPVMTSHCGVDYEGDEPPLTEFPIKDASAFVPKWLRLDYRKGKWCGEFGY